MTAPRALADEGTSGSAPARADVGGCADAWAGSVAFTSCASAEALSMAAAGAPGADLVCASCATDAVAPAVSACRGDVALRTSQASATSREQASTPAVPYQNTGRARNRRPDDWPSSSARILMSPVARRDDDIRLGRLEPG